jgi:hypothetical protein
MATAELVSTANVDNGSILPLQPDKFRGAVVEVRKSTNDTPDLACPHLAKFFLFEFIFFSIVGLAAASGILSA